MGYLKSEYADDDKSSIFSLLKIRVPSLLIGLVLGAGISLVTSNFKQVLAKNIELAFFLPFIVYIADAIGTQTEAIYTRDLKSGKASFYMYFKKEILLGAIFGMFFALTSYIVSFIWLNNSLISLTLLVSSFITTSIAPVVGLLVAHLFFILKKDPAAGTGPVATVVQDTLSVVIYGLVANFILL